jgi:hypothetical protein
MLATINENYIEITSGSFGEGLEMKGSDIDLMFVMSYIHVYEDINKVRLNSRNTGQLTLNNINQYLKNMITINTSEYDTKKSLSCGLINC